MERLISRRLFSQQQIYKASKTQLQKTVKPASEKALDYINASPRIRLQNLMDNPGARTTGKQVKAAHNQAGHTIGELQHAAKPPLGWIWGDFFKPWQRMFPGDKRFNGDINIRREYIPLSLVELQRIIDLGWLDTSKLIDVCALCATRLFESKFRPDEWRQFGIHLTDEGDEIFSTPINLEVQWASLSAIAAIERVGGSISTAYYDLESMKAAENAEAWFRAGKPIPRRKYPPHSLITYYMDPDYRGYLANPEDVKNSQTRLAEIIGYTLPEEKPKFEMERKNPEQVFLGLESGQLVSLADEKVFEPTDPAILEFYRSEDPLADHLR